MTGARDLRSSEVLEAKAPDLRLSEAERIVREVFGIRASASPLVSERDQNFRLRGDSGRDWVFKIANPAEDPAVLDFQAQALIHVETRDPGLPVPRLVRTRAGSVHETVEAHDGSRYLARLVTFLPGVPLDSVPHSPALLRHLGGTTARLGRALRGYFHPAAGYVLLWDLKRAGRLRQRTQHIEHAGRRKLAESVLDRFEECVLPELLGLRAQVIHNDVSANNTVVNASDPDRVAGVIDFGDMVRDPHSLEPAAKEAQIVMNRMREDGVLVGREGPHSNVLKIRPPLAFSDVDADRLVQALDTALDGI